MTGTDVDTAVQAILGDSARGHWSLAQIQQWIHEGEVEHAIAAPASVTHTVNLSPTAASATQQLPAQYSKLLDIVQNMGADGSTPGRAITFTSLDRLRAVKPNWRTETGSEVRHFMRDERDERTYFLWPTPADSIKVESIVMALPVPLTALSDVLTVGDAYLGSMTDYVLHRAYASDAEDAQNANLSTMHFAAFAQKLGIKTTNWKAASPVRNSGESPTYPVVAKEGQ